MRLQRLTRLSPVLAICWQLGACVAPTLPTPPPTADSVALVGSDAVIMGSADPRALVACLNEDTGRGVIESADDAGDFVIRVAAEQGHHLTLWQVSGGSPGQLLDLVVPAPTP